MVQPPKEIESGVRHRARDRAAGLATVEAIAAVTRDALQGLRERGLAEHLAGPIGVGAVDEKGLLDGVVRFVGRERCEHPRSAGEVRRNGEAFAGECDGRREEIGERLRAVAFVQCDPGIDQAGHRTGAGATLGNAVRELIERREARRAAARVQALDGARAAVPDEAEGVAAEMGADGHRRDADGGHGDGRIDRAASVLQDGHADE